MGKRESSNRVVGGGVESERKREVWREVET